MVLAACGDTPDLPVSVAGVVTDASNLMPATSVVVEVEELGQTVLTDTDGRYGFALEAGAVYWFRASDDASIPTRRALLVPTSTAVSFALDYLPAAFPAMVYPLLGMEAQAADRGVVAVHFIGKSFQGGEGATLDTSFGASFSFGMAGPVLTSTLPPGFYDGLIFSNVVPGTVSVTVQAPACTLVNLSTPTVDVFAGQLTRVDYDCR